MFLRAVLLPFVLTRAVLAFVAWFGTQVSASWSYPHPAEAARGWSYLPVGWLDAFGRWDASWYLDVARNGYALRGPPGEVQSNVAFFPLYPWAVRALHALVPGDDPASWYVAALLVSNAAALCGLWLLWKVTRAVSDEGTASRAVLYALLFPTGFVLSAPYPESLFLLLSAGALLAGTAGRFALAGALGFLLALCRPGGVLVALPLAWLAWTAGGARRGPALLAAALPGAGLALHAGLLWRLTGDPLALVHAQAGWGRTLSTPWRTLLRPLLLHPHLGPLEYAALALVAAAGAWLASRRETRALGIWALASLAPPLLSGALTSAIRFAGGTFPVFVALALAGRAAWVDRTVVVSFSAVQAALFLLWSRYFWIA